MKHAQCVVTAHNISRRHRANSEMRTILQGYALPTNPSRGDPSLKPAFERSVITELEDNQSQCTP